MKRIYRNRPQMLFNLVMAQSNYLIWGRGTGKSTGAIADFSIKNIIDMPRSNGIMVGKTFEQLKIRTLPPVIVGWEDLGYIEGVHFFIGKKPPESWKWPRAYQKPVTYTNYISFWNGSGIYLVSQDRPGTSNSLSVDWMVVDEAKLINKARLDEETILTLRGNRQYFGNLSNHYSQLYTSDRPKHGSAKWLLEQEHEMDLQRINLIIQVSLHVSELQKKLVERQWNCKKTQLECNRYTDMLNTLRKNTTYVSFASTLDNIDALGLDALKNLKRKLSPEDFKLSVLNKETIFVEQSFYKTFDFERSTYDAPNYSAVDSLDFSEAGSFKRDSSFDSDYNNEEELDIAFDHNAAINCLVIGQPSWRTPNQYNIINSMFVDGDKRVQDLVADFCNYYKDAKNKTVNYFYDHTVRGTTFATKVSGEDLIRKEFETRGWAVRSNFYGQAPEHQSRFYFFEELFSARPSFGTPRICFNFNNTKDLITSVESAEVIMSMGKIKKNKKSERSAIISPQHATHFSEALDMLLYGKFSNRFRRSNFSNIPI